MGRSHSNDVLNPQNSQHFLRFISDIDRCASFIGAPGNCHPLPLESPLKTDIRALLFFSRKEIIYLRFTNLDEINLIFQISLVKRLVCYQVLKKTFYVIVK